jgi:hypothetical protein
MKRTIGFLESYREGFPPSRTPPWGVALLALEGVGEAEPVVTVTVAVTVVASRDAMMRAVAVLQNLGMTRERLEESRGFKEARKQAVCSFPSSGEQMTSVDRAASHQPDNGNGEALRPDRPGME